MTIIPLTPPFSKGEIRFPPLEKGGQGNLKGVFSGEFVSGWITEINSMGRDYRHGGES